MPINVSFSGIKFAEAIAYLRDRLAITEAQWGELQRRAGAAAARSISCASEAMRRDLLESIVESLEMGTTAAKFRDDYDSIVKRYGWRPEGKEPGWLADVIYHTEIGKAQAAGRWEQIQRVKALRPYVRYATMDDNKVRPKHAVWHNIVLAVDHPFWLTHWPLNGLNCRCSVMSLNERDLVRYGFALTAEKDPRLALPPDEGWSGNEGVVWRLARSFNAPK